MTKFEVDGKCSESGLNKFPPPNGSDTLFTFRFSSFKISRNSFNLKSFQREAFHLRPTTPRASSISSFLFLAETNPSDSVPRSAGGVWRFCPAPVRTQLQKSGFKSVHEANKGGK